MQIVPVIDLLRGQVVRGIAGRRSEYRPLVSQLAADSQPTTVAQSFRDRFGLREIYLADLDAIEFGAPQQAAWSDLQALGCQLWIDAGRYLLTCESQVERFSSAPSVRWILGLESLAGPAEIEAFAAVLRAGCAAANHEQLIFSLDLRQNALNTQIESFHRGGVRELIARVQDAGFGRLIVLDLADVGVNAGVSTLDLVSDLRSKFPALHLTAGGGVRSKADLTALRAAGAHAVLIASALHDGRLMPSDLAEFQ